MRWIGMLINAFRRFFKRTSKNVEGESELEYLRNRVTILEKQVEQQDKSVERAKSMFLNNLYHEIRTPLNAIIGFSDLIEMNSTEERKKENFMRYVKDGSQTFLKKMDNIIEASIIQAGLLKIEYAECKPHDILSEIHAYYSLHKHIIEKNIVLLLSVPKECKELVVMSDSYRISQIISNLVSNSFKHTIHGVIEIGFSIEDHELHFFVKDTGSGGLEGYEESIFRNFAQVDENEVSAEGLGLGLSLSKSILDLMGGKISYKSKRKKGTQFFFSLPYKPVTNGKSVDVKQIRNESDQQHEPLHRAFMA